MGQSCHLLPLGSPFWGHPHTSLVPKPCGLCPDGGPWCHPVFVRPDPCRTAAPAIGSAFPAPERGEQPTGAFCPGHLSCSSSCCTFPFFCLLRSTQLLRQPAPAFFLTQWLAASPAPRKGPERDLRPSLPHLEALSPYPARQQRLTHQAHPSRLLLPVYFQDLPSLG